MTALSWRFLGPYRGGRVMAVAGHPTDPRVAFFGSTGGGVWKTTDGGANWRNLTDGFFKRSSVGALALAPSDPYTIYVGMGECGFRANVTHGDGVYRTTDGGGTWSHLGLAETQNIGRIRVHPRDPDLVYLAAMGHRFGPNGERGVYRSRDGGRNWERVLFHGPTVGAVDLAMDMTNPRILYAALWEAQRYPWGFASGGPGSSIYKTTDGGDTWTNLSERPGFPSGPKGRIGVCVSPVRSGRLYAIVTAAEGGGVYRSSDGGESWTWTNDDENLRVRGWYEAHIVADPRDADTVWLPNRKPWKSTDGGRTFRQLNTSYWDQHDLWVDPGDTRHLVVGNDGGASISYDGGETWSTVFNQPTAELYHAAADTRFPYRVYSAQQDNSTISLPSRSDRGPISEMDWFDVGGGESGYIAVRADNPDIVFGSDLGGGITRYDHRTGALRDISPWPESMYGWPTGSLPYRFNWALPLLLSRHDPGTLYAGANVLFRTTDEGQSWTAVSPDLTRRDAAALAFSDTPDEGGCLRESAEDDDFGTIATIAEGTDPGVLWTGSDDGVVSVTRDGGASWRDVTPPDLPEWARCCVEASRRRPGGAYLAATRHKLDDFRPYLYRTDDYGAHWQAVAAGIPEDQFVRVVRADLRREGLLYCGTEAGVYFSLDDGASWQPLQANLPACAVYDLAVHEDDLLAATHGRGFWIMDDLSPLHQMTDDVQRAALHLFRPRPAYRLIRQIMGRQTYIAMGYAHGAENPPAGVVVTYHLRERPTEEQPLTLTFLGRDGHTISTYTSAVSEQRPAALGPLAYVLRHGAATLSGRGADETDAGVRVGVAPTPGAGADDGDRLPAEAGLNRFALPLLAPGAPRLPGLQAHGGTAVPLPPGVYGVRLQLGGLSVDAPVEVRNDPRSLVSQEDLEAQYAFLLRIRDTVAAAREAALLARDARAQLEGWIGRSAERDESQTVTRAAASLRDRLPAIEEALTQPRLTDRLGELSGGRYPVRLDGQLEALAHAVSGYDAAPTEQAKAVFARLSDQVTAEIGRLRALVAVDVPAFNALVRDASVPTIVVESREPEQLEDPRQPEQPEQPPVADEPETGMGSA